MQLNHFYQTKPKIMKIKFSFLPLFFVAVIALFTSCTKDESSSTSQAEAFVISQVAASTKSVTISWLANTGNSTDYTILVYNDARLSDLAQKYDYSNYNGEYHRFTIPFLDNTKASYVVVKDSDGKKTAPFEVALKEQFDSRLTILSQNFDNLCWGYDYINSACGIRLNSEAAYIKKYPFETLAESIENCYIATSIGNEGGLLFNCSDNLKELLGVNGWEYISDNSKVYIRPGYIKLGSAASIGDIKSPVFGSVIKDGEQVTAVVKLDVCMYSASSTSSTGTVKVAIVKGNGSKLWSKELNLEAINGTPKWQHYEFEVTKITADCHFEISTNDTTPQVCFDNLEIIKKLNIQKNHIYGFITDKDTEEPIPGVAVSDGFKVVVTDKDGFYSMEPNKDTYYVFYSLPAEYKVTIGNNGLPKFFTRYVSGQKEYNFTLRKLDGGIEKKFALFALADPQVSSSTKLSRFTKEAVPFIGQYAKSLDCSCYGITLGDIISNSSGSNSESFRTQMRDAMHYSKIKLPVYQVMGNHDANYYDEINTLVGADKDERNIKAQRAFESTNGPINYSFNRGNVHVIGMKDIVYNDATSMANYTGGFIDSQYEWLKQDLAVVSKDKTVVLCVHIPLHNYRAIGSVNHIGDVHQLLNQFKEAHILSGHTHYNLNKEPSTTFPNVYEHNVGTVCGTWWTSNVCGDGTPNGFGVFISDSSKGSGFTDWYYMGYTDGMNTRDYQLRLYRGNAITGAKKEDNKNGTEGYYQFSYDENVILANVFNADSQWKIEVHEDGVKTGEMTKLSNYKPSFSSITGKGTWENPYKTKNTSTKKSSLDMWVVGFHMGVLDRFSKNNKDEDAEGDEEETLPGGTPSNGSWTSNDHMYSYTLKNKDAKVKVVAIDRFGNKYETDKFVDYQDNDLARKP